MNIKISFPDGSEREFPKDISSYDVAMSISPGLARNVVAAKVNDKLIDLNAPIKEDASIELYKFDSEIGQEIYWHSTAHLMAQAVQEIYPDVKVTIGPAIENGFYYDFDKEIPFTDADLVKIEAKMKELSKQKLEYKREEISQPGFLPHYPSLFIQLVDEPIFRDSSARLDFCHLLPFLTVLFFHEFAPAVKIDNAGHDQGRQDGDVEELIGLYRCDEEDQDEKDDEECIEFPKDIWLGNGVVFKDYEKCKRCDEKITNDEKSRNNHGKAILHQGDHD